jgi:hypothetical protein
MSPVGILHAFNIGLGKDLWHALIEWVKATAPGASAKAILARLDLYARSMAPTPGRKALAQVGWP